MIDWQFIGTLEGQSVLTAYVPNASGSASGVTLATGVDLGQLTSAALTAFGLDAGLTQRLMPYVGLRGTAAVAMLAAHPLTITQAESDALDAADRGPDINPMAAAFQAAAGIAFQDLPDAAQTVMASVAFQYGSNLRRRCPRFWQACVTQDWTGAVTELRNFGDAYPTRRRKEAAYLAAHLST